jgi:hypothetical protein
MGTRLSAKKFASFRNGTTAGVLALESSHLYLGARDLGDRGEC